MNRYALKFDEVLDMPFKQLICLAKSIPKIESTKKEETKDKSNIVDFLKSNNKL